MQNVKNTMIDGLLSFIAPHLCSSCGKIGSLLCGYCKSYIATPPTSACWLCGSSPAGRLCSQCRESIHSIEVVGIRHGGLQRLIGGYKFRYMCAAVQPIAALLIPYLQPTTVIVPIPTQGSHIRVRGYDHIDLIMQQLRRRTGVATTRLLSTQAVHIQHKLNRKERALAVKQSFIIEHLPDPHQHYVLFDDIITTGATLLQAARVLRANGATKVSVLAIARQPSTKWLTSVKMGKVAIVARWRGDRVV